VILTKYAEEGTIITSGRSMVAQGADIVELGDLSKMFVEVKLDEADVASIRLGQGVEITIDAFPDETGRGVVTKIDPQAVTEQNITTVLVTVEVENPDARMKPGMTATCEFLVGRRQRVLSLPSRAVQEMAGRHAVMIVADGEEQAPREVKVGLVGDERTEILEGLEEGDEVVMPGLTGPRDIRAFMRERGRSMGGGGLIRRDSQ
jgi:RND family efflux transporter MFP subunit